jgi:hypothetical protein
MPFIHIPSVPSIAKPNDLPPSQVLYASKCAQPVAPGHFSLGDRGNSSYTIFGTEFHKYIKQTLRGTNQETPVFYVKNTHSNHWTQNEVITAKFLALTGIVVPWTVFGEGFEEKNIKLRKASAQRKDSGSKPPEVPNYFVASQRLRGYEDLSLFIRNTVYKHKESFFPNPARLAEFEQKYGELKILEEAPHQELDIAELKVQKRDLRIAIFHLLPPEFKEMLDEIYVNSLWLGNWDMFNWDLTNTGFTVRHFDPAVNSEYLKKPSNPLDACIHKGIVITPASIDFGNCLDAGYNGKVKSQSFERANIEAKEKDKKPDDYDPPIPPQAHIQPWAVRFDSKPIPLLSTIPRRLPFEKLFSQSDVQLLHTLSDRAPTDTPFPKGIARGLYRLSLIPDAAIDAISQAWWHLGTQLNHSEPDKVPPTHEEISKTMKERRDCLCSHFRAQIKSYCNQNHADALETKREAQAAIYDLTKEKFKSYEI